MRDLLQEYVAYSLWLGWVCCFAIPFYRSGWWHASWQKRLWYRWLNLRKSDTNQCLPIARVSYSSQEKPNKTRRIVLWRQTDLYTAGGPHFLWSGHIVATPLIGYYPTRSAKNFFSIFFLQETMHKVNIKQSHLCGPDPNLYPLRPVLWDALISLALRNIITLRTIIRFSVLVTYSRVSAANHFSNTFLMLLYKSFVSIEFL